MAVSLQQTIENSREEEKWHRALRKDKNGGRSRNIATCRKAKICKPLLSPPSDDELDCIKKDDVTGAHGYNLAVLDIGVLLSSKFDLEQELDIEEEDEEQEEEDEDVEESNRGQSCARLLTPPPSTDGEQTAFHFPSREEQRLRLPGDDSFRFTRHQLHVPPTPRGVKRARHKLDVDGPNTADLACKKRRLRIRLITSRLSQPYSQPATHILNREGIKAGDKRFLKLATSVDTARKHAHLHATSVLRFALVNRMRRKLGVAGKLRGAAVQRAEGAGPYVRGNKASDHLQGVKEEKEDGKDEGQVGSAVKEAWHPHSLQAVSGGKYLGPRGHDSHPVKLERKAVMEDRTRTTHALIKATAAALELETRLGCDVGGSGSGSSSSNWEAQAAAPIPDNMHTVDESYASHEEDGDESLNYPYLDEDGGSEDRSEDGESVYSDFSMIFRAKSPSEQPQSPEEHTEYEEYLEELDGISWVT